MFVQKWRNLVVPTRRSYDSWRGMHQRCLNPKFPQYADYGGRGITICARWLNNYDAFYDDMGLRQKGYTLERINNEGNYEPGNCRWATQTEQNRNMRKSVILQFNGKTQTASEWRKELGFGTNTIRERLQRGLSVEQALSKKDYRKAEQAYDL